MAVFRIEKTKDYTVMSNHHLRNNALSLKAKGLLSLMLSLPEDWDYTVKGLSYICKDGIDSINGAVRELEISGYINRQRIRNEKGQLTTIEYTIKENPEAEDTNFNTPTLSEPKYVEPIQGEPKQENPIQEKLHQLNTNKLNKDIYITNQSYQSNLNNRNSDLNSSANTKPDRFDTIRYGEYRKIKEMVHENIEYEQLKVRKNFANNERLDGVIDLIVETICSTKENINIGGEDYPSEIVKEKLLKINASHINYIFECLDKNTTYIRNIKRYLLVTLFNAPSTISNYYSSLVNYDLNQTYH